MLSGVVQICYCVSFLLAVRGSTEPVTQTENPVSLMDLLHTSENKSTSSVDSDFVSIAQPPRLLQHRFPLMLQFRCNKTSIIGVDIRVWTESQQNGVFVSQHRFNCSSAVKGVQQKILRLVLPRYLAFKPGRRNRYSVYVEHALLQVWMLDFVAYDSVKRRRTFYNNSTAKDAIELGIVPVFHRPQRPSDSCIPWDQAVANQSVYNPKCFADLEVIPMVTFPLAVSGSKTGVHRKLYEYKNQVLKSLRKQSVMKPRYSLLFWLYVVDYCPSGLTVCSLLQHITWDDRYATPQLSITNLGQIHYEIIMANGSSRTFTTPLDFVVPKEEWVQLIVACETYQCVATLRKASKWKDIQTTTFKLSRLDEPYFDDTMGFFVAGGSELVPTFQGYIGQAIMYRRRLVRTQQTSLPSKYHPMFELGLNQREQRCRQYIQQVNYVIFQTTSLLDDIIRRKSCMNNDTDLFFPAASSIEKGPQCNVYDAPRTTHYQYVNSLVRQWTLSGYQFSLEDIGRALLGNATYMLERNNMREMQKVISLLKQGSCYGNHDATFMLSVILNYGISTASQEIQSHSYLMYGALDGNRLCLLSMGNKHVFGLDGIPADLEQAYAYYKTVADMTRNDLEDHRNEDVYTEMIRLTDTADVEAQTEETGDYFLWLKHQASQGVLSAQQNMARMMYWGSQGLQRDVLGALEYYRLSAESGDPTALYNYGIVLLKGHGTEKNMTLAMEVLEKAAKQNHHGSLNTIGWYALEIEKNYTKAAHYFHRSYDLGNKDSAYNLAHMYLRGFYPNSGIDRVKAWEYMATGATRGQLEAGTLVGMYNMRGHPTIDRNVKLAVDWARYVGEQNPATGILLAKGLKAYRKNNWPTAFVYYVMAASTGVEVANFNLAYLCEEDNEGLVAFMEKECKWRHYNLSTQRAAKDVNSYAWIKMAEYHYYAADQRDPQAAADLYCNAAINGDPQGLFSLAYLVEEGIQIADSTWIRLQIPLSVTHNNVSLLTHLYSRCTESTNAEAFLPCTLALYRIQAIYLWNQYQVLLMMLLVIGFGAALTAGLKTFYAFIRRPQPNSVNSV